MASRFYRISHGIIINVDEIKTIALTKDGDKAWVTMKSYDDDERTRRYPVTSEQYEEIAKMLLEQL